MNKRDCGIRLKIVNHGNSNSINLPTDILKFFGLDLNDELIIKPHEGSFAIFPVEPEQANDENKDNQIKEKPT